MKLDFNYCGNSNEQEAAIAAIECAMLTGQPITLATELTAMLPHVLPAVFAFIGVCVAVILTETAFDAWRAYRELKQQAEQLNHD